MQLMRYKLFWLPALVFTLVGAIYLYASITMPEAWSGGYGHRLVPLTMSLTVVVLAGALLIAQLTGRQSATSDDEPILLGEFFMRVAPLIMLMLLFGIAQVGFGFLFASLLCGVMIFKLFGNTWSNSLLHAAIGTLFIYFLFFKLLNLYDPPGRIIDLSGFF